MSLAVPIVNSLTFIFSLLTGLCLGEKIGGKGKSVTTFGGVDSKD